MDVFDAHSPEPSHVNPKVWFLNTDRNRSSGSADIPLSVALCKPQANGLARLLVRIALGENV